MHLPQAYRSLPRPSSLSKPSHPPTGVVAPAFTFEIWLVILRDQIYHFDNEAN
jgi:hypothetical protein